MDEAVAVFSHKGLFHWIVARDVRSREHARKLWPLVSPDALRQMVTWVTKHDNGMERCWLKGIVVPALAMLSALAMVLLPAFRTASGQRTVHIAFVAA